MNLSIQFSANWKKHFIKWNPNNCYLILAVSGGVDSIVMTHLITNAGFKFSIAHCNFQLRGADSERDEAFVKSLPYTSTIFTKKFNTAEFAETNKIAIQEAARKLRYFWFESLINELNDRVEKSNSGDLLFQKEILLVTAHHADDNIETVLMNFFRGTGILGLKGMMPFQKEKSLIRPLLGFRKKQLIQYAIENELPFVEDVSNISDKYTRNFFRNQLIPQIQTVFPQTEENILQNIERMRDVAMIYQESIAKQLKNLVEKKGEEWHVPVLKLKQSIIQSTIVWEISKQFGFKANQVPEIIKLLDADNGAYISSPEMRIIKNRKWLIIAALQSEKAYHIVIEKEEKVIQFPSGVLAFKLVEKKIESINSDTQIAYFKTVIDSHTDYPNNFLIAFKHPNSFFFYF